VKRMILAIGLLAMVLSAQANEIWSGLWRNADQRGEALLHQGDATAAAKTYDDPRRKAYAELKSGDYATAAREFSKFDDGESKYNQGNALAFGGDLPAALKAYDDALQRDPRNLDARHNRDLVAKALKQKPQQQKPDADKPQDGNQKAQSGTNQDDGKQGDQTGNGKSAQNDHKDGKDGQNASHDGKVDKEKETGNNGNGNASDKNNQSKKSPAQDAQQAGNRAEAVQQNSGEKPADSTPTKQDSAGRGIPQQGKQGDAGTAGQTKPQSDAQQRDDAAQARQDAEASLAKAARPSDAGKGIGEGMRDEKVPSTAMPVSESQLAQEQWLRSIADDPGGLLRRKFLIEHMMRQQKAQE